ncbi:MAG: histidine kinase, partial [Bacteroidota bacterium]
EKAQAELRLLKAQIHPHFLFNTLNNLYSLTVEKSDQAPEVVERLSEMLDYQLYQCNTPKVAVRKEIELLENYIQLESLRYGKRLRLSFEHSVDDPGAQIAPLILISPVENAFKHGASGNADSPFIEIQLNVTAGMLYFNVRNNKPPIAITDHTEYTEGIGLNNIRKQLRLLYPDQHVLTIEETEQEFHLSLVITL